MTTAAKYPSLFIRFNDKTTLTSTFITKRKVGPASAIFKRNVDAFEGIAKVRYNSRDYNEFEFSSVDDFRDKILPCLEKELLNEFGL